MVPFYLSTLISVAINFPSWGVVMLFAVRAYAKRNLMLSSPINAKAELNQLFTRLED